jgi:heme-degrading monooxygenase HmoA
MAAREADSACFAAGRPRLAQLNVARALHEYEDTRMDAFVRGVALVNGAADRSRGFVWRLADPSGRMNSGSDPNEIVNLSVWESIDDLRNFLSRTVHRHFHDRKAAWFAAPELAHAVMWWVARDHRPTLEEGLVRLHALRRDGPTPYAFDWSLAEAETARLEEGPAMASRRSAASAGSPHE